jgi:hypothetical protein
LASQRFIHWLVFLIYKIGFTYRGGVKMIENDTLVKHKILGYEGLIDGQTSLKMLFTGERGCTVQYRIKVLGQDKRYIAPEEDLAIGNKDKEKEMQGKFKKARLKKRVTAA